MTIVHGATEHAPDSEQGLYLLSDLFNRPDLLAAPRAVVPRLAYEGRITLLSAPRKSGKSTLVGAAVSALSRGDEFLGNPTTPGTTVWAVLDEPLGDLVRRFGAGQADGTQVFVAVPPCTTLDLIHYSRPQPDASPMTLLVIDAIGDLHARELESENDSTQVRRALAPLREFSRRSGTAVILLGHTKKSDGRARGAGAYEEVADLVLTLKVPENDAGVREVMAEGRVAVENFRFRLCPGGVELADHEPTLFEQVESAVRSDPGSSTRKVAEMVPRRAEDVRAALAKLELAGRVRNLGKGNVRSWFAVDAGREAGHTEPTGARPNADAAGRGPDAASDAPRGPSPFGGLAGRDEGGPVA